MPCESHLRCIENKDCMAHIIKAHFRKLSTEQVHQFPSYYCTSVSCPRMVAFEYNPVTCFEIFQFHHNHSYTFCPFCWGANPPTCGIMVLAPYQHWPGWELNPSAYHRTQPPGTGPRSPVLGLFRILPPFGIPVRHTQRLAAPPSSHLAMVRGTVTVGAAKAIRTPHPLALRAI